MTASTKHEVPKTDIADALLLLANHHQFAVGARLEFSLVRSRMLLWCRDGQGRVRINGCWHPLSPGDFLFLPWDHSIRYEADETDPFLLGGAHFSPRWRRREQPIKWRVLHLAPNALAPLDDYRGEDLLLPGISGVYSGRLVQASALLHLAEYSATLFARGLPPEEEARFLGRLMLAEIIRVANLPFGNDSTGSAALLRVQTYLRANLRRPLSIPELAKVAHCSAATLNRNFVAEYGMPPMLYVQQQRMLHAAELLVGTSMRIGEVAQAAGVPDPYYFSRLFKKQHGCSPREYRSRHFAL